MLLESYQKFSGTVYFRFYRMLKYQISKFLKHQKIRRQILREIFRNISIGNLILASKSSI